MLVAEKWYIPLRVLPFRIGRPLRSVSCTQARSTIWCLSRHYRAASIIKIIYHIILEFVVTSTSRLVTGPIPGNDKHSSFFSRPGKNSASNERDDNDDDHEGKILKNIIYLYIYNHGNVIAFEPEETRRSGKPGSRS